MSDITVEIIEQDISLEVQSPEINLTLDLNSFQASSVPSYTFTTLNPLSTWTINHNLGYKPIVQLFNSGSQMIFGSVSHTSVNQVVVSFTLPTSGFARLI